MKEKIKTFLKEYGIYFGVIILLILYGLFIGEDQEKIRIFINFLLIFNLIYIFFFKLKEFENFIIKKFTLIFILGIIIIIGWQKDLGIDNKDTLLMIGGIIAFWYGFKRYERDKELEMIDKLLNGNFNIESIEDLKKYAIIYISFKKNYIPEWIWEKIVFINNDIVYVFITEYFLITNDDDKRKLNSKIKNITDIIIFDNDFAIYFLNYLKSIVKDINEDKHNMVDDKEKNIAANLNALIESIEEANRKYNIKL